MWEPTHEPDSAPAMHSAEGRTLEDGETAASGGESTVAAAVGNIGVGVGDDQEDVNFGEHWSMGAGAGGLVGSVEREMLTSAFLSAYGASVVASKSPREQNTRGASRGRNWRKPEGNCRDAVHGASEQMHSKGTGLEYSAQAPGAEGLIHWEYGVVLELQHWAAQAGASGVLQTRADEQDGCESTNRVIKSWVLCWNPAEAEATRESTKASAEGTANWAGTTLPSPFSCWKDRYRRRCVSGGGVGGLAKASFVK